jgi:hypothetical protein
MDGIEITARPPLAAAIALLQVAELPIEDLTMGESTTNGRDIAGAPPGTCCPPKAA